MDEALKERILEILNTEPVGVNIVSDNNGKVFIRAKEHPEHRLTLDNFADLLSVVAEWADEKIAEPEGEEKRARVVISVKTK